MAKELTKLQPMMVRPSASVRNFLESEVANGNASTMSDAFNKAVETVIRDRDEVRRELVTAFGGRDALVIGILVARTVAAFEKAKGPARETPEAWASCSEMIAQTLASIAPPATEGFTIPRAKDEISDTELLANWAHAVSEGWHFEPAADRSPLLPAGLIARTLEGWKKAATPEKPSTEPASPADLFRRTASLMGKVRDELEKKTTRQTKKPERLK